VPASLVLDANPAAVDSAMLLSEANALDFDAVYEQHFDFVWRNARRLGVRPSALDDVTQEVFLVVHRRLPEFEGRSSLRTWLYVILKQTARNHRRAQSRKPSEVPADRLEEELVAADIGPETHAERAQAIAMGQRALAALDEDKREVFILAELEQITVPEISVAIGVNPNTVYARLRAARQAFDEAIKRERARDEWRTR
jgi:RNA polymerase sigma-70 factor (ECF subfamily)